MLVAVLLRFWGLGEWSLFQDELYTLRDSSELTLINPLRPVYFFLQHGVLQFLPASEFGLRLLPLVFGVASIVVIWWTARNQFGEAAAVVVASLTTVSAWHLFMSQYARYWSLLFLLVALLIYILPRAVDKDSGVRYLLVFLVIALGTFTHPTFLFPLVGIFASLFLVDSAGNFRSSMPSKKATLFLYAPLLMLGAVWLFALMSAEKTNSLTSGLDLAANLRILPAVIQRMNLSLLVAALVSIVICLADSRRRYRLIGVMTGFGMLTTFVLLLVASPYINAYADYAFVMMPLVFIVVGAAVQLLVENLSSYRARVIAVIAVVGVLGAGFFPSTVSHMRDGGRFDYKSAYRFIEEQSDDAVIFTRNQVIQKFYAPERDFELLGFNYDSFRRRALQHQSFWVMAIYRRRGLARVSAQIEPWLAQHCENRFNAGYERFDYREYRIKVFWCDIE